jgi:hypothetical protein
MTCTYVYGNFVSCYDPTAAYQQGQASPAAASIMQGQGNESTLQVGITDPKYLSLWLLLTVLCTFIAKQKNRNFGLARVVGALTGILGVVVLRVS